MNEVLQVLRQSPVLEILMASNLVSQPFTSLLTTIRMHVTSALSALEEEQRKLSLQQHTKENGKEEEEEEIKERNWELDRKYYLWVIDGVKSVLSKCVYGRNKCDYSVCC